MWKNSRSETMGEGEGRGADPGCTPKGIVHAPILAYSLPLPCAPLREFLSPCHNGWFPETLEFWGEKRYIFVPLSSSQGNFDQETKLEKSDTSRITIVYN